MTHELLSLRVGVVAKSVDEHDLFRRAVSASPVPIEIIVADGAAAAQKGLSAGADLLYIDEALPAAEIAQTVAAARAGPKPAFTVLLRLQQNGAEPFETDGLAAKPRGPEEAKGLVDRSIRVRLPTRVLVVDDSAVTRGIVRKLLLGTRLPLQVSEAGEGFAALELVREGRIDIVFVDYNMPNFSGLETISEFKRQKQRVYVVLISAMSEESLKARARESGVEFLKKPFYPADVDAALCPYYGLRALNPKRAC